MHRTTTPLDQKPRVLVLGADGFIGRRIVAAIEASGWASAVAAGRRAHTDGPGAERLCLDATDQASLDVAFNDITSVVNCVAGDSRTIIENARAVFGAARSQNRPLRVVHLSSMAVYGALSGEVSESAPLRGDIDDYGSAKVEAERIAAQYPFSVILRPGIVYGPRSPWWSDRIARLLVARRLGDLGGRGNGVCNLVFVDDVAQAVVTALRAGGVERECFNLSLPAPPSWNEYFARYAAALGAAPPQVISAARIRFELWIVAPALKLAELAAARGWLRHPPPPIRPWLLRLCAHRITLSVAKAERLLGMRWTDPSRGLADTAAWFQGGGRA